MKTSSVIAVLSLLVTAPYPGSVLAQDGAQRRSAPGTHASEELPLVNGEVRRIDRPNRKLTIRHEAIPNLNMEGMTMVFGVVEPKLLDDLEPGDRIRFTVRCEEGRMMVMRIERVR